MIDALDRGMLAVEFRVGRWRHALRRVWCQWFHSTLHDTSAPGMLVCERCGIWRERK